jgi:hypothetical protein
MRPDGTPRYTMVFRAGPLTMRGTSDYFIYEPPHRTVNRVLDNPLGGTFYITHEPMPEGTQVTHRWEPDPPNPIFGLLLPVVRPLLAWQLQRDLDTLAKGATPQGHQAQDEDSQRQGVASGAGLLGGGVVAAAILTLYLLLRRRRRVTSGR